MSGPYELGEIVDITIKGVRVTGDQGPRDTLTIADEHGTHYVMPPQAKVERAAPPEWPPRVGDLWRDRLGGLFFVQADDDPEFGGLLMRGLGGAGVHRDDLLAFNGPLTLVHREDEQPRVRDFETPSDLDWRPDETEDPGAAR